MPFTPRVFSGIQPSGDLHLGNYLGAIKRFVPLQQHYECIYCVVDEHAITVWQEPDDLRRKTREVAAAYVAAGVDPKNHIIFNQSRVHQHAELAWVFNCVARMGWMNRMTQWKDKTAGKNAEAESLGLFAYPSLMAADILLYKATHVPVGDDQKQHLELARDIAMKFNLDFKDGIRKGGRGIDITVGDEPVHAYFPMVEPLIDGPAPRVMSLRDGTKKMSKSDPSDLSRINLMDDEDAISKKIRKAKTDPDGLPSELEGLKGRPEADNLVGQDQGRGAPRVRRPAVLGVQAGAGRPLDQRPLPHHWGDAPPDGRHVAYRRDPQRRRRKGAGAGRSRDERSERHHRISPLRIA